MNQPMRLFKKRGWYHVEFQRHGKTKALRTKDEEQAQAVFKEMEREYLRGRLLQLEDYAKITLGEFAIAYEKSREGISIWTIKKDNLALRLLGEAIGASTQLRAITDDKILEFKKACRARGTKEITINGYLRHIKAAFSWAVVKKYLDRKPTIKFYRRKTAEAQETLERILAPDEIKTIMGKALEADPEIWRLFTVLLWTGGRRREALNLTWQKINFKQMEITLDGKTGRRTIPMLPAVREALEPIKKDLGRVFPDWYPDTVSKKFKAIARAAEVPDHRLHDLRHTAATYMVKNGVPLDTVQKIMGHASISTTQIYAKVLQDVLRAEMSKLRFD